MMRLTRLNFVSSVAPIGGWRMGMLVIGLIALGWAGLRWASQQAATAAAETQLISIQPRSVAAPVRSAVQQRELEAQAKVIGDAVRQLNLPIGDLIKALQPPKDIRVALLALDVGGKASGGDGVGAKSDGILKITAEARTAQEMTTYVAFLDDQALFRSIYLIKHEINATSPEKPYRFLLEAQWRE